MRRGHTLAFRPDGDDGGEQKPQGWQAPDDWPDQFADPGALLEAYNGLRPQMDRLNSQLESERQQFTAALEQLETARPPATPAGQEFDPTLAAYAQAYESGDTAAMLRLSSEAAGKTTVQAVAQLLDDRFAKFEPVIEAQTAAQREAAIRMAEDVASRQLGPERYQELLPAIRTLVSDHPHYLPSAASVEGYASAILDVAKLAEHETLASRVQELEAERAEKLAAQGITGAGRGSVYSKDEQQAEFERVKATPLGDYRQVVGGS